MPILFRGTAAGLNGTLRCHPKEAQALARERLPTKDLSIICRTPTRHELLLTLAVILSVGPVLRSKTELSEGSMHFENRMVSPPRFG